MRQSIQEGFFHMTQTASILAASIQNPEPPNSGSAPEHPTPARQAGGPNHAGHTPRAVLHLPTRMRGGYRQAPSLKGA